MAVRQSDADTSLALPYLDAVFECEHLGARLRLTIVNSLKPLLAYRTRQHVQKAESISIQRLHLSAKYQMDAGPAY